MGPNFGPKLARKKLGMAALLIGITPHLYKQTRPLPFISTIYLTKLLIFIQAFIKKINIRGQLSDKKQNG